MSPVWRSLLSQIAEHTDVVWVGGAREVPGWLSDLNISTESSPPSEPTIRAVSCASPRHEILEAFRWARRHMAKGVLPQELAIATASPALWDDHVLAQAEASNLPVHFIHGRAALSTAEGQLCAALAEILLRGFSRTRVVRLVALLRNPKQAIQVGAERLVARAAKRHTVTGRVPLARCNRRVDARDLFGREGPPTVA